MPRYLFGGSPADFAIQTNYPADDATVRVQPEVDLTVWSAPVAGTRYTDLQLEFGGSTVAILTTSVSGRLPRFYGPDGVTQVWIDMGDTDRYVLESTDLGSIVDTKLDKTAQPSPHQHSGADVPSLQRQIDATMRCVMFDDASNTWPYQSDVTPTYPPTPMFWYGNAALPVQARWGLDYVDQLDATNHGGSTNIPDPTEEPTEDPVEDPDEPTMTIAMSTPVASINGAAVTVSAALTTAGGPQTFARVQVAVRGPSGQTNDVAYRANVTVDGTLSLTGGFTASASGTWTAYATYNKTGGSAQSDWVDGPKKTFTVTLTPPDTGNGGTTPPTGSASVPKVNRSGIQWNSGVARWDSDNPDNTVNLANAFGTWRGRSVDGFLHFPKRQTWNDMFNGVPASWANFPGYIVYSIPPQPETEGAQNNSATAAGQNNTRWEDFGKKLTAMGLNRSTFILRIWEVNGYWYKWAWGNERGTKVAPNTVESFVAAMKNLSTSVKKYAPNIKISINMTRGQSRSGTTWQSVYNQLLGNHQYGAYFDVIGYDTYDWYPATNTGNWNGTLNEAPGFNDIVSYCRSNGKQIGVEEWGLVGGGAGGGADNPYFITQMYGVFNSIKDVLAYEATTRTRAPPTPLSTG